MTDLTNKSFGKLIALYPISNYSKNGRINWYCKCECGGFKIVPSNYLQNGNVQSCGCKKHESKNKEDLTGQTFNRLTVIMKLQDVDGRYKYVCECSCGSRRHPLVRATDLKVGKVKSCGCLHKEQSAINGRMSSTIHNDSHNRLYHIRDTMIQRCTNPNQCQYKHYGAKGIKVCDRWLNGDAIKTGYEYFKEDVIKIAKSQGYSEKDINKLYYLSLDRINSTLDYEPDNIRWATMKEQQRNKSSNRILENNQTLIEFVEEHNLNYDRTAYRLNNGWTLEEIINNQPKNN